MLLKPLAPTKYNSIPVGDADIGQAEITRVLEVLRSGHLTHGAVVEEFEARFAAWVGARHAVACNNGTSALHLALLGAGVRQGDEVILPSLSYVATANAVRYCGAVPVFVDVDPETWTLDISAARSAITSKTRAIIGVSLLGNPIDMSALNYPVIVTIEDGAQGLGTVPTADITSYSFYGNKTITTGEGGMVVTKSAGVAVDMRHYRGQGQAEGRRYWHDVLGYNYRMTNISAALGIAQLDRIDSLLRERRGIMHIYQSRLKGVTLQKQDVATGGAWACAVLLPKRVSRDGVMDYMLARGIETRPMFYPIHTMPMYATGQDLSITQDISRRGLILPTYPSLSNDELIYICDTLHEAIAL